MTAEVQDCTGPDWTAGRSLLEHHARSGRVFDANTGTLRAELRYLGFGSSTTGRLFQLLEADGVIRQVGVRRSTGRSAHGAFVRRWLGAGHRTPLEALIPSSRAEVVVPVQRDRDGRFSSGALFTDVPLPMEVGT